MIDLNNTETFLGYLKMYLNDGENQLKHEDTVYDLIYTRQIKCLRDKISAWAISHPAQTRLDYLKQHFPYYEIDNNGFGDNCPTVCCKELFGKKAVLEDCDIFSNCLDCWNRPLFEL